MTSADPAEGAATRTAIRHDVAARRFVAHVDGVDGIVDYALDEGVMAITHTGVPPQIGGRGIAADLVRAALDFARAEGLRVLPRCSYAEAFVRRHREYADLLA